MKIYKSNSLSLICAAIFISSCASYRFPIVRPVKTESADQTSKNKAQDYFICARDYERRGLDQTAERYYEMAYELDPSSNILKEEVVSKYIDDSKFTQALLLVKGNKKNEELDNDDKRLVSTIYLKMGEFGKAADVLESIDKRTDEEIYSLGLIYESLGDISKALKNYQTYFKHNPDALQLGIKIGKMFISEKRYDEAESLFVTLGRGFEGDNPDILTMIGVVKVLKNDTANGLKYFDEVLNIDSLHEDALRNKAQIFLNRNDLFNAIACYEKLHNIPEMGDVYDRTLALLYYYNHQNEKAEELLNELLKSFVDDFELHYYLGLVFTAREKNDLAVIEFEKSIAIRGTFEDAWRELCYLYVREKNYDQAFEIANRYVTAVPTSSASWRLKGYVCDLKKNFSDAIDALKHAVEIDHTDAYSWFELGSSYERNKDIDSAALAFKAVLKLHPEDPAALNYLGYMWAEKGKNLDSAKILLETALKHDPENGAFLDSYAWIFYQMGRVDTAYILMKKVIKKITDDPVVFCHMGDILYKLKDYQGAVKVYQKGIDLNSEESDIIRKKIIDLETFLRKDKQ